MTLPLPAITGIILAAGSSQRMGKAKQLLPFQGKPLLQSVIDNARCSDLKSVFLVLGYKWREISAALDFAGVDLVINGQYDEGQSASIKSGLKSVSQECQAAVFLLGDQPLVSTELINRLIDRYQSTGAPIIIPTCGGERGNPVLMDRSLFPELLRIEGDLGGRAVFSRYSESIDFFEVESTEVLTDIDTPEDYKELSHE